MKTIRMWFDHSRKTYNLALDSIRRKKFQPLEEYKLRRRFVASEQLGRKLGYLESTPSKIRAGAITELCNAFKSNFGKKKINPNHKFEVNFKSRKNEQSISLQADSFVKSSSKDISKLFFPRSIKDPIRTSPALPEEFLDGKKQDSRLVLDKCGHLYYLLLETKECDPLVHGSHNVISLDPGVRTFQTGFSMNNGEFTFAEYGNGDIKKIVKLNIHLDKLIGTRAKENSWRKRKRLQRAIEKLRRRLERLKKDCHHRVADDILTKNDVVLIPNFEVRKMVSRDNRKISKSTVKRMLSWSHFEFRQLLITKAKERGKRVIVVTEEYTSKTCCNCGTIKWNLRSNKVYKCKHCRIVLDRDFNGAINIMIKYLTEMEEMATIKAPA